jgi:hypothetical protein
VTLPSRSWTSRALLTGGVLVTAVVQPIVARAQDSALAPPLAERHGVRVTILPDTLQFVARRDSFRVVIQGSEVGSQVVEVSRLADSLVLHERTVIPLLDMTQETRVVMALRSLAPWSVAQSGRVGTQDAETLVVVHDGWARGQARTPQPGGEPRVTAIDTVFPSGTIDVNQIRVVVPFLPLVEGTDLVLDVFNAADASIRPYVLRVEPDTASEPDTTYGDVYRVLVLGGEPTRLTVRRDWPRQVVRVESVGQPIVFELVRSNR